MNRRILVVVAVALVAATASTIFFYRMISDNLGGGGPSEMSTVVIASRNLPRGTMLAPSDMQAAPWAAGEPPEGSVSDPAQLAGRALKENIGRGEPVLESRLAVHGAAGISALIPQGMRAVTLHVEEVAGVNQLLTVGDRVDLMAANNLRRPGYIEMTLETLLENVEVLSDGRELLPGGKFNNVPTVTVLIPTDETERVLLADQSGSVRLALRNPLDEGMEMTHGGEAGGAVAAKPRKKPSPVAPRKRTATPSTSEVAIPKKTSSNNLSQLDLPEYHRQAAAPEATQVLLGIRFAGLGDAALAEFASRLERRHLVSPVIVSSFQPGWDVAAAVEALDSRDALQIFVEPRFITPEKTSAVFAQSSEVPLRGKIGGEGGVQPSIERIELDRVGVRVTLTPTLLPGGRLRINVRSESGIPDPDRSITLGNAEFPRVSVRQAECDVDLVSGQSFWVRGLIDRPGAWDFLRMLFPAKQLEHDANDELAVLVTARILSEPTANRGISETAEMETVAAALPQ